MSQTAVSSIVALATAAEEQAKASTWQMWGAFLFGVFLGWFTYFVNRHRTEAVKLADLGTVIAAVGAGAVLSLFPAGTDLFGAYGIGLATGFFAQFVILVLIVLTSPGWTMAWFLDGRRPKLKDCEVAGDGQRPLGDTDGPLRKALDV